jgi:tRNA(fMet)-specific endonuclease VapC
MHILDTDLFSDMDRADSPGSQRLRFRLSRLRKDEVVTTVITFEEQMRGWMAWLAKARSLEQQVERYQKLNRLLSRFQGVIVVEFDGAAAAQFEYLQSLHLRIGTMDLKIAAIALSRNATLLSRNLKDFQRVPGLKVEDWSA